MSNDKVNAEKMKIEVVGNTFIGYNDDASPVFEYEGDGLIKELVGMKMRGWLCVGPLASKEEIQQAVERLQRALAAKDESLQMISGTAKGDGDE